MREAEYARYLKGVYQECFPGCVVIEPDPRKTQGFPDHLILFGGVWAAIEVKLSAQSHIQPNQAYYVDLLGQMSFAAFIWPENEQEVLYGLQQAFGLVR